MRPKAGPSSARKNRKRMLCRKEEFTSICPMHRTSAPGKVVKKLVYCLLAFFLGWAGIHKFYAGRIGAGIVYLLFCWTGIPAIIAFIEFIIGLCKKADAAGNIVV